MYALSAQPPFSSISWPICIKFWLSSFCKQSTRLSSTSWSSSSQLILLLFLLIILVNIIVTCDMGQWLSECKALLQTVKHAFRKCWPYSSVYVTHQVRWKDCSRMPESEDRQTSLPSFNSYLFRAKARWLQYTQVGIEPPEASQESILNISLLASSHLITTSRS